MPHSRLERWGKGEDKIRILARSSSSRGCACLFYWLTGCAVCVPEWHLELIPYPEQQKWNEECLSGFSWLCVILLVHFTRSHLRIARRSLPLHRLLPFQSTRMAPFCFNCVIVLRWHILWLSPPAFGLFQLSCCYLIDDDVDERRGRMCEWWRRLLGQNETVPSDCLNSVL